MTYDLDIFMSMKKSELNGLIIYIDLYQICHKLHCIYDLIPNSLMVNG